MKKNNTKKLAKQIACVLNNPDCPTSLYNAIADELTRYSINFNSPQMIERSLRSFKRGAK